MVLLLKSEAVALSKLQLHVKLVLQRNNFPRGAEIKEENYEFSRFFGSMCGFQNRDLATHAKEGYQPLLVTRMHWGARLSRPPWARRSRRLDCLAAQCCFPPPFVHRS